MTYGIKAVGASNISITGSSIDSERFPVDISGSYPLVFERNTVASYQYSSTAFYLTGVTSGSFSWNRVSSSGSLVMNNVINGGGAISTGLSVGGSNNIVSGNVVRNRWTGMAIGGTNATISGNSVIDSWERGMAVGGTHHTILANKVTSHYAHFTKGLVFYGDGNVYKRNDLRGNGRVGDPAAWQNCLEDFGTGNLDAGGNLVDPPPCDTCGDPE